MPSNHLILCHLFLFLFRMQSVFKTFCWFYYIGKSFSRSHPFQIKHDNTPWVSWRARRSIQSILKEINPEYSSEAMMLKLKLQYFGHLMQRANSLEKPWHWAGGEGGNIGWDGWMASSTQWTWVYTNSGRWWRTGKPGVLQSMGSQRVGHDWVTDQKQHHPYLPTSVTV